MKVKVKIAVVMDKNGDWSASGWKTRGMDSKLSERQVQEFINIATESLDSLDFQKTFFVEAEIEVPEEKIEVIPGTVVEA